MNYFYLDASAWVKRYHTEPGSDFVNLLFQEATTPLRIVTSLWSFGETFATLNRTKNRLNIPEEKFDTIAFTFFTDCENLHLLPLVDNQLFISILHIKKHNLNSADAYHLSTALALKETLAPLDHTLTFIGADARLLKAAKGEDIHVFDPEHDTAFHFQSLFE